MPGGAVVGIAAAGGWRCGRHAGGRDRRREHVTHQLELQRRRPVPRIARDRLLVVDGGKARIDVAQVFVGDRVVGRGADRGLELVAGEPVFTLLRIEDGKVVVRFRQLRKVAQHRLEHGDRLVGLARIGERQALEKARLRLPRTLGRDLVQHGNGVGVFLLGNQAAGVLERLRVDLARGFAELAWIGGRVRLGQGDRRRQGGGQQQQECGCAHRGYEDEGRELPAAKDTNSISPAQLPRSRAAVASIRRRAIDTEGGR